MKKLAADLKANNIEKLYLFTGDEPYLINMYEKILTQAVLPDGQNGMNHDRFTGKNVKAEEIFQALETLPFMSEKRLVTVVDSGLFASGRKAESESFLTLIKDLPDTSVLLFVELNVDKRLALYKAVAKSARVVEFKTPSENDMLTWIIRELKKGGLIIDKETALCLLRSVGDDMETVLQEINKLISYKNSGQLVSSEDIDTICAKNLEARVFDLVGAVAEKNVKKAMDDYNILMALKESPIMVLTMIARQFRLILECKDAKGSNAEIAAKLDIRPFVVTECVKQGRNFTKAALIEAVKDCYEADLSIKTGRMADRTAIEILIAKYAAV
ncbi:MAG: DNA polymerase III subunit delta [Clostridiales bacterium]|jgi:DNA polymerase-3 subunit delta|nr:DNA polymerase III subunit delta [Clostridiales bacterium]